MPGASCRICERVVKLEYHWMKNPDNIVRICHECHVAVHRLGYDDFGWLMDDSLVVGKWKQFGVESGNEQRSCSIRECKEKTAEVLRML